MKKLEYNEDRSIEVNVYDTDISGLKEGTFFGIIANIQNMTTIYPYIGFDKDNNVEHALCYKYDLINENFDIESNNIAYGEIPLIFKKLKGNLAQEILTGEIFIINGSKKMEEVDEILDKYLGLTSFIDGVRRYENNNIVINCIAKTAIGKKQINNAFIIIDDQFKYFYSEETLAEREEITRTLKSITDQARAYFDKRLKQGINFLHSIAQTENLIYDANNDSQKLKLEQHKD